MKDFCQNQYCENPGAKIVPVSVRRASDQNRTLCVTCEESYNWGVQHGMAVARTKPPKPRLEKHLKKGGFVILTYNQGDPSTHGPFEAWAYEGPLDLQLARPVTFGVGTCVPEALEALEHQLGISGHKESRPAVYRRRLDRCHVRSASHHPKERHHAEEERPSHPASHKPP